MSDTAWVTGAKGFIGRHLSLHLSRAGIPVSGLGHGAWPELESNAWGISTWLNGEIDATGLEFLKGISGRPSRIFHVAGGSSVGSSLSNPLEDYSRTVSSTSRLLDWMRANAPECVLLVVSSAAVYGSKHSGPIPEDAAPDPVSPYGHHKWMMEELCRSYSENFGLPCISVRLFSVYGTWLRKQLLWDLCSHLAGGPNTITLAGTGAEVRDWIEVRDVARALDLASSCANAGSRAINGGSGIGTSVADVAAIAAKAWGGDVRIRFSG